MALDSLSSDLKTIGGNPVRVRVPSSAPAFCCGIPRQSVECAPTVIRNGFEQRGRLSEVQRFDRRRTHRGQRDIVGDITGNVALAGRYDQRILKGLFWKLHTGAQWRDIPERYGPWKTIHDRYRRWCQEGRFAVMVVTLRDTLDAQGLLDWEYMVD